MTLTLTQYQLLDQRHGLTTRTHAARQLAALGLVEITRETRIKHSKHDAIRAAVEYVVTENGLEELQLSKSVRLYNRERNRRVYERHARGETYVSIGASLGIRPDSASDLARTWEKYGLGETHD